MCEWIISLEIPRSVKSFSTSTSDGCFQHQGQYPRTPDSGQNPQNNEQRHACSLLSSTRQRAVHSYHVIYHGGDCIKYPESWKCRKFVLAFNLRLSFPHGPWDWSISRKKKKKQWSDFSLLINLPLELSFFLICLLLFPLGSKGVLYLSNDSVFLGHLGLWKPHSSSSIPNPPIYNHRGELFAVLGVINDSTKLNLCFLCLYFSKMCSFKFVEAVASEETFISSLTSFVLYSFSILLSHGG